MLCIPRPRDGTGFYTAKKILVELYEENSEVEEGLTSTLFHPADPRGITKGGLQGFPTQL